jgi:UDPglucose 6-dehydrogenase
MLQLSIFGTGYVGLVTGACLAEVGHEVMCMDVDQGKIEALKEGRIPIWEPGLENIVKRNLQEGRLHFTSRAQEAVAFGTIQFIAVGTPPDEDGSADLRHVLAVADAIAQHMDGWRVIINKSTVPVGTADRVQIRVQEILDQRKVDFAFDVISNPEFLKEGSAVADFLKPDRIIVGSQNERATSLLRELYEPFNRNHNRTLMMDVRSAELTKYAANAMLATRISFMNEMANLSERLGADIEQVRRGIGSDPRIGYHFIYPGCGYGGSCFPKDVQALARTAAQVGYEAQLLQAVEAVNERQKDQLFSKLSSALGGPDALRGQTVAVWGLAFKPNTDDMREAPSSVLMAALFEMGVRVQAFDPVAMDEARRIHGERPDLHLASDKYAALQEAVALVICTEWQQFRAPDFEEMASRMKQRIIIDGRNLYSPEKLQAEGWRYVSVGRAASL